MKFAILSDIHGNLPALETVLDHIQGWQADMVIVNGDIVNRGPSSAACWARLQTCQKQEQWHILQGNHEAYVYAYAQSNYDPTQFNAMSFWTYQQMNGQAPHLQALPEKFSHIAPNHTELRVCHASMRHNRDGLYPDSSLATLRPQIAPAPAVFVTGHTHYPFIRHADETLIVNVGSVGQPCDGDTRASYAQITWQNGTWQTQIMRLTYDRAQTERDFRTSGFLEGAGPIAHLIYHEWRTAKDVLVPWLEQYGSLVKTGMIDEATAVRLHLQRIM